MDVPQLPPSNLAESRGTRILAGTIVLYTFATIFYIARALSRTVFLRHFYADDYALTLAWVVITIGAAFIFNSVHLGLGHHVFSLSFQQLEKIGLMSYLNQIMFVVALPLTKISICLFYGRVLSAHRQRRLIVLGIMGVLGASIIAFLFPTIFQCRPVNLLWTRASSSSDGCLDYRGVLYATGVVNILADILLIGIITASVLNLDSISQHQRIALLAVVQLGWLAAGSGLARIILTARTLRNDVDASWKSYQAIIWTACEINVSLICAAAPGIMPILRWMIPALSEAPEDERSAAGSSPTVGVVETKEGVSGRNDDREQIKLRKTRGQSLSDSDSQPTVVGEDYNEIEDVEEDDEDEEDEEDLRIGGHSLGAHSGRDGKLSLQEVLAGSRVETTDEEQQESAPVVEPYLRPW